MQIHFDKYFDNYGLIRLLSLLIVDKLIDSEAW